MNIVAQILATLAVSILQYLLSRRDLMEKGQAAAYEEALRQANIALRWKADAAASPDHGATLRVQSGAAKLTIPGYNPDTSVPSPGNTVPSTRTYDVHGGA